MKAAILTAINQPLQLKEAEPLELQYGQVRVKVLASGICGAQLQEIRGEKGSHFPRFMGHEGCGIVQETGTGVRTVKPGDKVVLHWRPGDGIESEFPWLQLDGRAVSAGKVTTFSEETVVSENRCTAIPEDAPVEFCALLGCGLSTALGTIEQEANLLMGESVLIIGCGGLGLNLIRAARMRKAGRISALDCSNKFDSAIECGATEFSLTLDSYRDDRFDVVIDTTGDVQVLSNTVQNLAPSGRYFMVGQPKPSSSIGISNPHHLFDGEGKTIKATQGGGFRPHKDIPRYYQLWKSGQLSLDGIITHRLPLERINEGISLVQYGKAGRVLIEMP